MEHIYRGFRISLRQDSQGWHAKFWRVSGASVNLKAFATEDEGSAVCAIRANQAVDLFLDYVGGAPKSGD